MLSITIAASVLFLPVSCFSASGQAAIPAATPSPQASSSDSDALVTAANARIAGGHEGDAKQLLERALSISPNSAPANLALGQILLSEKHYPEAMDRFEAILAINLRNADARAGELSAATALAIHARLARNQDAALKCLQHARESLPDDPTLLTDLGIQALGMHLLPPAAEALHAALALKPDDPTATYAMARVEIEQQQPVPAEQHLRAYLAARPDDATAHYGLGHLLQMQLHTEAAAEEFQRSIALQPVQTESYYQLGQMALDAGHEAEARSRFEKTLARSPTHGGALTGLGILAYRSRNYSAARQYLTAAAEAAPDYQPAHYYLGLTLARLGDKPASDRELKTAVTLAQKQQGRGDPIPAPIPLLSPRIENPH